jgi:molybdopterin/thiamine biosynthesis adenylyltransferase
MLNSDELERYSRQILIREGGEAGQKRLKQARIVIAGVGGLGSAAALYLVAAGVGTIRLIDHDEVALSNLNRQVLHWSTDIGRRKVISGMEKLRSINPGVTVEAVHETITETTVYNLIDEFDLIVDAMDNLRGRFLLNIVALEQGKPLFHGAVRGFEGRAMTVIPGSTACLKCLYHGVRTEEVIPVIGTAPAIVGAIQATEVIKYIMGIGKLLENRLVIYDGINMRFTEFNVNRNPLCPHCSSIAKQGGEKSGS